MYPNVAFEVPDPPAISVDGKTAYLKWKLEATNAGPMDPPGFAATGRRVEAPGADEYRLRDGLLAHYRAYYNMSLILARLGLATARDSRTFKTHVCLQPFRNRPKE